MLGDFYIFDRINVNINIFIKWLKVFTQLINTPNNPLNSLINASNSLNL